MDEDNYNQMMKLLLIGNSKTGKTNFINKYLKNKFDPDSKATLGVEFGSKCFRFENFIIKFQIWDTAGLERYKTIFDAYYNGSSGVFIFYDITDKNSFNCIDIWFKELKSKCKKDAIIIIIGNKSDLEEKRQVTKEEGESKAKQLNAGFFETSALTGENLDKAFEMMATKLYQKSMLEKLEGDNTKISEKNRDSINCDEEKEVTEEMEDDDEDVVEQEYTLEGIKKCSSDEHNEIDANIYCQECKIYMCHECEKAHLSLFKNHHIYILGNNIKDIFTGICKIKNHSMNLDYFCRNHNKLCCAACIAKIKGLGNGFHKDCNICFINEIKNEKKDKLNENIKCLEDISKALENSINELKIIFENLNKAKEELKLNIQSIFTKLRNELNEREKQLLLEVDKKIESLLIKENFMKKSDQLPIQIKNNLEKAKSIINNENAWNENNQLSIMINDCINIEKNIKDIYKINKNIEKKESLENLKIEFEENEDSFNELIQSIKDFGKINIKNDGNE